VPYKAAVPAPTLAEVARKDAANLDNAVEILRLFVWAADDKATGVARKQAVAFLKSINQFAKNAA
jgi:hypothetical protein